MMKRINLIIILITSILSIVLAYNKHEDLVLFLKDIAVILTISVIYILQKIFKFKISDSLNFIYIIFIFMAHFLGVVVNLYDKIYWFDKFVHFLSGIITSFVSLYVIIKFRKDNNIKFTIIYIIAFSLMCASLWEIFEYLSSYYFNVDPQKVQMTGVTDTMGDIIVAFLGSIIVGMCYYYEYVNNKILVITKYIKSIK